jgi:uncharacterized protein with PIN domain
VNNDPKSKPQFIVDGMLGSLARWLRLLGFDTLYCDDWSDDQILKTIGNRILLTRDKELLARALQSGFQATNPGKESIKSMLRVLQNEYNLTYVIDPKRSRCSLCNASLTSVLPSKVRNQVPKGTLRHQKEFWQCTDSRCQHVFWQGAHWKRILRTVQELNG